MSKRQKLQFTIHVFVGLFTVFAFAAFWFRIQNFSHNFSGTSRLFDFLLFIIVTYIVWLPIYMKLLLWAIASHIRPVTSPRPKAGLKVAFITTFVPGSESIHLLDQTLPAMVNVSYPHDTWLLDEGNDPQVIKICKKYGVRYFSRYGKSYYNTEEGKYAVRTKGGNHNSWYNEIGNSYDFVAQVDTDFIPHSNFLQNTLGYFNDQKVAFVGTPQIYANTTKSFIARGASQQTYNFYGSLLRGMDGMDTTLLIGANHVIRVAALKDVGHYSAHITEDLLTGMKLHAKGWKSKYVPEVLAVGEGPNTWRSYFNQQKRWAYGCMHILFNHSFKLFKSMTLRRAAYYFSIQQHYFTGIAMLLSIFCLTLYFFFGIQSMNLDLKNFLSIYVAVLILLEMTDIWLQRFNIRPDTEKGILWSGMCINIAAWPIFLLAFLQLFTSRKLTYKVTPKGKKITKNSVPFGLFIPHILLGLLSLSSFFSSFYTHRNSIIMLFWALYSSFVLLLVPLLAYVPIVYRLALKYLHLSFDNQKEIAYLGAK